MATISVIALVLFPAVTWADPPAHNAFAAAVRVSTLPFLDATNTDEASVEGGEPRPSCGAVAGTVWYVFRSDSPIEVVAETTRSGFDTVLAVYRGSSLGSLTEVACNDDTPEWLDSRVALSVSPGVDYYFQAGGLDDRTGELRFGIRPASSGAIAGRVTGGGAPAADVCVSTYDPAAGEWMRSAATDSSGDYAIDELPPASYLVYFEDCTDVGRYEPEWHEDAAGQEEAEAVAVGGGTTSDVDADLEVTGAWVPPSPSPSPATEPSPAVPGGIEAKRAALEANRTSVRKGRGVRLLAVVSPCQGHEGHLIHLHRDDMPVATEASDAACTATFRVKLRRKATFVAVSPQQDADHGAATSNAVTVKVRKPKR